MCVMHVGAQGWPPGSIQREERQEKSLCNEYEAGFLLSKLNDLFGGDPHLYDDISSVMILSPYKGQVRWSVQYAAMYAQVGVDVFCFVAHCTFGSFPRHTFRLYTRCPPRGAFQICRV